MTLVEDYLRAVAILLPRAQRDDIVAELRDMILTRIETREGELGRGLTDDETEQVLRNVGHPLVVAARYRDGPQHVVGPALYPYWMFAVKVGLAIQLAIAGIVFVARTFSGGDMARAFGLATGSAIGGAATLIGFATAAAWLIERNSVHIAYLDRWRVKDLRLLDFAAWDLDGIRETAAAARTWNRSHRGKGDHRRGRGLVSRGLSLLATGVVLILWWLGFLKFDLVGDIGDLRSLGWDPGALETLDWRAFVAMLFWPGLAYGFAIAVQGALILAKPSARRLRGLMDLAIGAGVMATCLWIWTASPLAGAVRVTSLSGLLVQVKTMIHHDGPVPMALIVTLAIAAIAIGALGRMSRGAADILISPRF